VILTAGALVGPASAADDATALLLQDAGPGFTPAGDVRGAQGLVTRSFRHVNGELQLTAIPVDPGVDVNVLLGGLAKPTAGFVPIQVEGIAPASWFVPSGSDAGSATAALVFFASQHAIFSALLVTDGSGALPPVPTLLDIARRQVERAGGPPAAAAPAPDAGDRELEELLPQEPASQLGFEPGTTIVGDDTIPGGVAVDNKIASFLNDRSRTAVRVWVDVDAQLSAAVSVTRYPYSVFAAAALASAEDGADIAPARLPELDSLSDVVTFVGQGPKAGQVGSSFRRGHYWVIVLAQIGQGGRIEDAANAVVDLTRQAADLAPAGASSPYRFPPPRSTIAALALTALLVTGAGASSIGVGRARAWTLRRSESGAVPIPSATAIEATPNVTPLDEDAHLLRRRGAVVVVAQLAAVDVIVVALAGDFGMKGIAVAILGLAAGLGFTSWWRQREIAAIGADAPRRQLILPRFSGLVLGIVSLATLALGVSYAFKGLRYLLFKPTLAQLGWSDRLGLSPRGVGVAFAIGGLVVAALGGILFRLARALGRANTHKLLSVDRRAPILYLRSFGDDQLRLATIASARRPFFELFSFRGRDPFEEAVAWELTSYGPVVAVGRPGHTLASLGAAREHLSDDTWRTQVAARMEDALAVAVATGETPGLQWELEHIVTAGHLHKAVFLFPPVPAEGVARRWEFTAAALQAAGAELCGLPTDARIVHTVQLRADGEPKVTVATTRDEATYRTAVDRAMAAIVTQRSLQVPTSPPPPGPAASVETPWPAPSSPGVSR
jgi:hypothetical protein